MTQPEPQQACKTAASAWQLWLRHWTRKNMAPAANRTADRPDESPFERPEISYGYPLDKREREILDRILAGYDNPRS